VISLALCAVLAAPSARPAEPQPEPPGKELFPGLIEALKASPGCLGVETARTHSGKAVVFVWFADKKAATAWYNSDTHRKFMREFFPDRPPSRAPMAGVPDEGPLMMVASVTPNPRPTKDNPSPFKQIAIEIYQPVTGGIAIGGRFAPREMVPPKKDAPKR
jgi:hypothetical protein